MGPWMAGPEPRQGYPRLSHLSRCSQTGLRADIPLTAFRFWPGPVPAVGLLLPPATGSGNVGQSVPTPIFFSRDRRSGGAGARRAVPAGASRASGRALLHQCTDALVHRQHRSMLNPTDAAGPLQDGNEGGRRECDKPSGAEPRERGDRCLGWEGRDRRHRRLGTEPDTSRGSS